MDPSPTAAENGAEDSWSGVPIAAVLCICLVVFLAVVVCLLCVRKLLQRRGVSVTCVSCACCDGRSRGVAGVVDVVGRHVSPLQRDWTARLQTLRPVWTESAPLNRCAVCGVGEYGAATRVT
ncbi:hypothetical protein GBAR_LOCUS8523 [Geodia barretti]|uniref:Uncharacterized protein n=1 Tax=Geodia barretti TaxID=519541 RepID=A0AA35WDP5_GEOBA|nr:hypothetical protein GBAR_LOCUS8523 [Geodia barretti]